MLVPRYSPYKRTGYFSVVKAVVMSFAVRGLLHRFQSFNGFGIGRTYLRPVGDCHKGASGLKFSFQQIR